MLRRFRLHERFRGEVKRLQKDRDSVVRAATLHVEHDACEIKAIGAGLDRRGSKAGATATTTGAASTASATPPALVAPLTIATGPRHE